MNMIPARHSASRTAQRGIALVVALIFLIVISIIGVTAVKFTSADVRSALNDEYRITAFQNAQSVLDAIVSDPANTPVVGTGGFTICTAGMTPTTAVPCDPTDFIVMSDPLFDDAIDAGEVTASVQLLGFGRAPPRSRGRPSSAAMFRAANFRLQSTYDKTASGQGRTVINQGLLLLVPDASNR